MNKSSKYMKGEYIDHIKKKQWKEKKMFHSYKSLNEFFYLYRINIPLSAVRGHDNNF